MIKNNLFLKYRNRFFDLASNISASIIKNQWYKSGFFKTKNHQGEF